VLLCVIVLVCMMISWVAGGVSDIRGERRDGRWECVASLADVLIEGLKAETKVRYSIIQAGALYPLTVLSCEAALVVGSVTCILRHIHQPHLRPGQQQTSTLRSFSNAKTLLVVVRRPESSRWGCCLTAQLLTSHARRLFR
jgi:hypothetical protein